MEMADKDPFGLESEALASYIVALGEPYKPYEEKIIKSGLFGRFLLDRVHDKDKFSSTLSKIDITTVCCHYFPFHYQNFPNVYLIH